MTIVKRGQFNAIIDNKKLHFCLIGYVDAIFQNTYKKNKFVYNVVNEIVRLCSLTSVMF